MIVQPCALVLLSLGAATLLVGPTNGKHLHNYTIENYLIILITHVPIFESVVVYL